MQINGEMLSEVKELARTWQVDISNNRETQEKKFHQMMIKILKINFFL